MIAKLALERPDVTVTLAGTVAAPLELERATTMPAAGAVVFKNTVPVATPPPSSSDGETLTWVRLGERVTVKVALWVSPWYAADIVAVVVAFWVIVVTANVPLVVPAAMVSVAGTLATAVLLLARVTTAPPVGAGPLRVTVAVEAVPPWTLVGDNMTETGVGDTRTVTVPVAVVPAG